ncbi:hypothetical protein [Fulvitalea axinellae]
MTKEEFRIVTPASSSTGQPVSREEQYISAPFLESMDQKFAEYKLAVKEFVEAERRAEALKNETLLIDTSLAGYPLDEEAIIQYRDLTNETERLSPHQVPLLSYSTIQRQLANARYRVKEDLERATRSPSQKGPASSLPGRHPLFDTIHSDETDPNTGLPVWLSIPTMPVGPLSRSLTESTITEEDVDTAYKQRFSKMIQLADILRNHESLHADLKQRLKAAVLEKQKTIHKRLELLHRLEQEIFRWHRRHPIIQMPENASRRQRKEYPNPMPEYLAGMIYTLDRIELEHQRLIGELIQERMDIWVPAEDTIAEINLDEDGTTGPQTTDEDIQTLWKRLVYDPDAHHQIYDHPIGPPPPLPDDPLPPSLLVPPPMDSDDTLSDSDSYVRQKPSAETSSQTFTELRRRGQLFDASEEFNMTSKTHSMLAKLMTSYSGRELLRGLAGVNFKGAEVVYHSRSLHPLLENLTFYPPVSSQPIGIPRTIEEHDGESPQELETPYQGSPVSTATVPDEVATPRPLPVLVSFNEETDSVMPAEGQTVYYANYTDTPNLVMPKSSVLTPRGYVNPGDDTENAVDVFRRTVPHEQRQHQGIQEVCYRKDTFGAPYKINICPLRPQDDRPHFSDDLGYHLLFPKEGLHTPIPTLNPRETVELRFPEELLHASLFAEGPTIPGKKRREPGLPTLTIHTPAMHFANALMPAVAANNHAHLERTQFEMAREFENNLRRDFYLPARTSDTFHTPSANMIMIRTGSGSPGSPGSPSASPEVPSRLERERKRISDEEYVRKRARETRPSILSYMTAELERNGLSQENPNRIWFTPREHLDPSFWHSKAECDKMMAEVMEFVDDCAAEDYEGVMHACEQWEIEKKMAPITRALASNPAKNQVFKLLYRQEEAASLDKTERNREQEAWEQEQSAEEDFQRQETIRRVLPQLKNACRRLQQSVREERGHYTPHHHGSATPVANEASIKNTFDWQELLRQRQSDEYGARFQEVAHLIRQLRILHTGRTKPEARPNSPVA